MASVLVNIGLGTASILSVLFALWFSPDWRGSRC